MGFHEECRKYLICHKAVGKLVRMLRDNSVHRSFLKNIDNSIHFLIVFNIFLYIAQCSTIMFNCNSFNNLFTKKLFLIWKLEINILSEHGERNNLLILINEITLNI
jgi:hypothetical protein